MSVSACLITYNEMDLILNCLSWLDTLTNLSEICIVDSYSNDGTWEIISKFKPTRAKYNIKQQEFKSFGKQKNDCIAMATGDWILAIDADETFGYKMNDLLGHLNLNMMPQYNAFRFITYITYPDPMHFINPNQPDPHIRLWRREFCSYKGDCHEILWDKNKRQMHNSYGKDICNIDKTKEYCHIVLLHHQRLKSKKSLEEKGERWAQLDMLRKSAEQGLPVDKRTWVNYKDELIRGTVKVFPIHREFWGFKTK